MDYIGINKEGEFNEDTVNRLAQKFNYCVKYFHDTVIITTPIEQWMLKVNMKRLNLKDLDNEYNTKLKNYSSWDNDEGDVLLNGLESWYSFSKECIEEYGGIFVIDVCHQNTQSNKTRKNYYHTHAKSYDIHYVFNRIISTHRELNFVSNC